MSYLLVRFLSEDPIPRTSHLGIASSTVRSSAEDHDVNEPVCPERADLSTSATGLRPWVVPGAATQSPNEQQAYGSLVPARHGHRFAEISASHSLLLGPPGPDW